MGEELPGARSPATGWLVGALRACLTSDDRFTPGAPPVGPSDLLAAARDHRVVGWIAERSHDLALDAATAAEFRAQHRQEAGAALTVMAAARDVSGALHAAGVRHLLVKGPALAHLQGVAPAVRGGGDVDVWVEPTAARRAVAALAALGWDHPDPTRPPRLPSRRWRDRAYAWFTPESALVRVGHPVVDLHWRLLRHDDPHTPDFPAAWSASVAVPDVGPTVRTLGPAHALTHLAAHGTKDGWPWLRHVVDVALVAGRVGAPERADLAGRDATVALALLLADRLSPGLRPADPGRRTAALATEAWGLVLDQRLRSDRLDAARRAGDRGAARARLAWRVRSAPSVRSALHPVAEAVLPVGALRDPGPLLPALARSVPGRRPPGTARR